MTLVSHPIVASHVAGNSAGHDKMSAEEAAAIARITRCFDHIPQGKPKDESQLKDWEIFWVGDIEHTGDIQAVHSCIRAKTITFAQITELYQKQVRPTFHQRKLLTQFYTTQKQSNFPSTAIWIFYQVFGSWANYFFKDAAEILAAENAFKRITSEAEINRQDRIQHAEAAAISIKKRLNVICQSNPSYLCNPETLQNVKERITALKTETKKIINELNSCRDELIFLESEEFKITKKTSKKIHNSISEIFPLISTLEGLSCDISETEKKLEDPIQSIIDSFEHLKKDHELEKILRDYPDGYTYSSEISEQKAVLNQVNDFIKKTIFSILKDTWVSKTGTPLETLNKKLDDLVSSTKEEATPMIRGHLIISTILGTPQIEDLLRIRRGLQIRLITTKMNLEDPVQVIIASFEILKKGYELEETLHCHTDMSTYEFETNKQQVVLDQANAFIKNTILTILKDTWVSAAGTPLETHNEELDALVSSTHKDSTQRIRARLEPSHSPYKPQFEELLKIRRVIQKRLHDAEETAKAHDLKIS